LDYSEEQVAGYYCEFSFAVGFVPLVVVRVGLTAGFSQTQAIDDAYRSVSNCDDAEKREEGKKIVEELAKLKYEVQHDRPLTYGFSISSVRRGDMLMVRTGRFATMDCPM
jgi:hypothetical protein